MSIAQVARDSAVITKRNMIKVKRVPDLIVFATLSPIMFVLLFAYVFGGAIAVEGVNYREFLIGGIFVQTVIFGSTVTGASLADDMQKGLMDRFRSLPMTRSAVLIGRTVSDVLINVITVVVMALTGLIVGWRIRTSVLDAILGFALLLLFAYAFSWVMGFVGLLVKTPEVVNNASFIVIFPLTFIANTFVPTDGFPAALRAFANWNPVSAATLAIREYFGNVNPDPNAAVPTEWSLQHPALYTLIWVAILLVVFVPLTVRRYTQTE